MWARVNNIRTFNTKSMWVTATSMRAKRGGQPVGAGAERGEQPVGCCVADAAWVPVEHLVWKNYRSFLVEYFVTCPNHETCYLISSCLETYCRVIKVLALYRYLWLLYLGSPQFYSCMSTWDHLGQGDGDGFNGSGFAGVSLPITVIFAWPLCSNFNGYICHINFICFLMFTVTQRFTGFLDYTKMPE